MIADDLSSLLQNVLVHLKILLLDQTVMHENGLSMLVSPKCSEVPVSDQEVMFLSLSVVMTLLP